MVVPFSPALPLLDRAGTWFLSSGIQEANGGVARYHRADLSRNAPISTEITGYAVSVFVYLFHATGDDKYLGAAERSAQFLADDAWSAESGLFPFECGADGNNGLAYFFDTGIIIRGLLAFWRETKQDKYLELGAEAGQAMIEHFAADCGAPHPVLELPSKAPVPRDARWSRSPGCYQLKAALAWLELTAVTGEPAFESAYREVLRRTSKSHDDFLPGPDAEKTMDRLHAYCYFIEALLADGTAGTGAVVEQGIARVSAYLRDIESTFVRSDVYAQLLRIRLWAEQSGIPLDEQQAAAEAEALREFACDAGGTNVDGGFWFGRKGARMLPFSNPVSTAFALQAHRMWEQRQSGVAADPVSSLI